MSGMLSKNSRARRPVPASALMQQLIRRQLIETLLDLFSAQLLVGEIQDGLPVVLGQLVFAGAEVNAEFFGDAEEFVDRLGREVGLLQGHAVAGGVVERVGGDERA